MAQIYYMLNQKLSLKVKQLILDTLELRILEPMRLTFYNDSWAVGKHYWMQVENNWNIVCWTSVAFIGLVTLKNQIERDYFISKAFQNTQKFLNNIRDDGYFNEGIKKILTYLIIFHKFSLILRDGLL